MKQKAHSTKHFNVVTNAQHGACLLFDRKGLGISQPQRYLSHRLVIKGGFVTDAISSAFLLFRAQLKNIMRDQKQAVPLQRAPVWGMRKYQ